ncbi:hypothetical protein QBC39DRAFT_163030 [Podospora conica]|nr:hypothetical protein QBC39DRAFT_163030 [Schizothecium conicum]
MTSTEPNNALAPRPQQQQQQQQQPDPLRQHFAAITDHVDSVVAQQVQALQQELDRGGTLGEDANGWRLNLELKRATKREPVSRAARARQHCLDRWRITAEDLRSLRPTADGSGDWFYRKLQHLATIAPWEVAHPLLCSIRDRRVAAGKKHISASTNVQTQDIVQALKELKDRGHTEERGDSDEAEEHLGAAPTRTPYTLLPLPPFSACADQNCVPDSIGMRQRMSPTLKPVWTPVWTPETPPAAPSPPSTKSAASPRSVPLPSHLCYHPF